MSLKQILLFFSCSLLFIFSIALKPYPFSWLVKLLPIMVLIFVAITQLDCAKKKLIILGLVCSAAGDFFLDYDRVNFFMLGLGAFFIAHLNYLAALYPLKNQKKALTIVYSLYGVAMFSLISGGLGELFVPVLAYMAILLLMAVFTLLSVKSNKWLMLGGLSFVLSDSLIGIDKFYQSIVGAHYLIMLSYYFAQFALLKGFLLAQQKDLAH